MTPEREREPAGRGKPVRPQASPLLHSILSAVIIAAPLLTVAGLTRDPVLLGASVATAIILGLLYVPRCTAWITTLEEYVRISAVQTGRSEEALRNAVYGSRGLAWSTVLISQWALLMTLIIPLYFASGASIYYGNAADSATSAERARDWMASVGASESLGEAEIAEWQTTFAEGAAQDETLAEQYRKAGHTSLGVGLLTLGGIGGITYAGRRKRRTAALVRRASRDIDERHALLEQAVDQSLRIGLIKSCEVSVEPALPPDKPRQGS